MMILKDKAIPFLFNCLLFFTPLVFLTTTSEVFEFNKMVLTYMIAVLITGVWIAKMIMAKKVIFRRTILDFPILILLTSLILSTIVSIDPRSSIFGYYSRFHGGLLSYTTYALLYWAWVSNMDGKKTKIALELLLASGVLVSIYGILEHFGLSISCILIAHEWTADCWVQDVATRVFATIGQPNWMAAWLAGLIPLSWAMNSSNQNKPKNDRLWLHAGISAVLFAALLFTKSRSGLLAFFAAYLIFWGSNLLSKKRPIHNLPTFLLNTVCTVVLLALFGSPWTPSLKEITSTSLPAPEAVQGDIVEIGGGGTDSGVIRKIVWEGAAKVWRSHPIFGSGLETFAIVYPQFRPREHNLTSEWDFIYNRAHNEYLNFMATTGTVGIASYLTLIIVSLLIIGRPASKHTTMAIALLAGYTTLLFTNFLGFSVVITGTLFFLFPAMAQTLEPKNQEVKRTKLSTVQTWALTAVGVATFLGLVFIGRYWSADVLYAKGKKDVTTNPQLGAYYLNQAIVFSPHEPLYHSYLATAYTNLALVSDSDSPKEIELAIKEANKAQSLAPRNLSILRARANMFTDLGRFDDNYYLATIETLGNLVALSPTDPSAIYRWGLAYSKIGNAQTSIALIQEAIKLKPDYLEARLSLAQIYKKIGLQDEARQELEAILEIVPEDQKIQEELNTL